MCGIFAFIKNNNVLSNEDISLARRKTKELRHRGPDNYGEWQKGNIFFGSQRLSINDLSKNGNQPFFFEDKVLVFNGEVYNSLEIREKLKEQGYAFKSNCDTEVFFYFIIENGLEKLDEINGMFSFIYFDGENIHFGNDIFSEKTLFYYMDENKIYISSEIKNIKDFSSRSQKQELIFSYLSFGHLIKEDTFYKNIYKLLPCQVLTLTKKFELKKFFFFDTKEYYLNNKFNFKNKKINTNYFFESIEKAINLRFIGDREIGLLYSGGLDSTIVADQFLDFHQDKFTIATYTNDSKKFVKENKYIENLNSIFINEQDFISNNKTIIDLFGQPIDSFTSLAINNLCADLSKKNIHCALSGMGGDELFFGYNKFYDHETIKFKIKKIMKLGIKKFNPSLLSKVPSMDLFTISKNYLEWANNFFIYSNNYNVVENIFFDDLNYFMPNSRCLANDVASMKHGVEIRGSFLDIDLLKSILNFDIINLANLGKKKILIDFYNNKIKNFNNYKKYPFFLRPKKHDYSTKEQFNFAKNFFPKIKEEVINGKLKDRIDTLISFYL